MDISIAASLLGTLLGNRFADLASSSHTFRSGNPLHHITGNEVKTLVKHGSQLKWKGKPSWVHWAVEHKDDQDIRAIHQICIRDDETALEHILPILEDENNNSNDTLVSKSSLMFYCAQKGKPKCLKLLLSYQKKGSNVTNDAGETLLHVVTSMQCMDLILLAGDVTDVNVLDHNKNTPLHSQIFQNNIECVLALLRNKNTKYKTFNSDGFTPLHVGCIRDRAQCIQMLFQCVTENGEDISEFMDARSHGEKTALQLSVEHKAESCALLLITHGASMKERDLLHLASMNKLVNTAKALICFGADVNAKDSEGKTPLMYATDEKMKSCLLKAGAENLDGDVDINDNSKTNGNINFIVRMGSKEQDGLKMLCLDGGGIRGLVLVQMLLELQKITGKHPYDLFDIFGGTSTGGILAIALAKKTPLQQCLLLYFQCARDVFSTRKFPYSTAQLRKLLLKHAGESKLRDLNTKKTFLVSCDVSTGDLKPFIFRTYSQTSPLCFEGTEDASIVDAMLSSGAAPLYFPMMRLGSRCLVDGGIVHNNPTMVGILEHFHKGTTSPVVLVSLGTCLPPTKQQPLPELSSVSHNLANTLRRGSMQNLDLSTLLKGISTELSAWKQWVAALLESVTDSNKDEVFVQTICQFHDCSYLRLNPPCSTEIDLAECDVLVLIGLMFDVFCFLQQKREELRRACSQFHLI